MPVIDLGSVVGPQGPQGATGATGAQGLQGNPGPNQVTNQTSTNLIGVLQGASSKVSVKPVDSAPTANSTNLVSSGGTKAALDTKANQGQLAYVENGTTASKTNGYAVGEYFCWYGLLYRAKTAIGNGDTFTENTNCEQVSEGGFNIVWKDNYESTTFSNLVNCNSCSTPLAVYQTLMASSKAVGYGEIGNQQTSQLKSFLTNPYANYTTVTFEFISAGLIRCTSRNSSDGSILGKVCYLKGTINNLSSAWTVTDWEDVDGAIGYKEVTLTTETLGTSFSTTSRLIGSASTLFGVAAEKILSITPRDNSLSPSANLVCAFYAGNFYLATTQSCTLSSSVKFNITYIK